MATQPQKNNPAPVRQNPAPAAVNASKPADLQDASKPAETQDASKPAETQEGAAKPAETPEKKSGGAIPQMPICVIYRLPTTKRVVAALVHPQGGIYRCEAKGMGGATGQLIDEGYPIGGIKVEGPKWAEKLIPQGVEVLGYAAIVGFPIPSEESSK